MRPLSGWTIAFDLDGTLVDTAPDLIRATNAVMDETGLPQVPADEFRPLVGHGARALIERAAARAGAAFDDARLETLTARFVEIYAADIAAESRPFPGAEEALDALARAGARLSVCTNKRTGLSVQLLGALRLLDRFQAVIGADSAPVRKPDASHLVTAVTAAGGDPAQAILVGDTDTDLLAARNAGAPAILVSFGYSAEPASALARRLGADAVIDRYADLCEAVGKLATR